MTVGPARWRPTREAVSGKVNRTHRQRSPTHADSMQRDDLCSTRPRGARARTAVAVPSAKVSVTVLPSGSLAKTAASGRTTATSSPGEANGLVASPMLDGKLVGAAGMTLHAAPACEAAASVTAATTRTTKRRVELSTVPAHPCSSVVESRPRLGPSAIGVTDRTRRRRRSSPSASRRPACVPRGRGTARCRSAARAHRARSDRCARRCGPCTRS